MRQLRTVGLAWSVAIFAFLQASNLGLAQSPLLYRPDRVLVQFKASASARAIQSFHSKHRTKLIGHSQMAGGLSVLVIPASTDVPVFLADLYTSGLVNYAEPDYIRHLAATLPNDPKFVDGTLWWLNNLGQSGGTPHADISAVEAWDLQTSASNMVVAVVDSGVRFTHEDLASNMWINPADGSHGWNALTQTNIPSDDQGHGSLVSGILGGVGNNGKGISGVAWKVQIMACACFDANENAADSDIIGCLDFARTNGAKIINASWGSYSFSQSLSNAVYALREAGLILVAAAGNDFRSIDVSPYYPACYDLDNVVSVAYTTRNDALGLYSNFGSTNVDLAAPGAAIYSTFFASDSSYLGGAFLEGTSMSAPLVAGALAMVWARHPAEPHPQIIARILAATDPVPALAGKCVTGGRLNLFKALSPPLLMSCLPSPPGMADIRVSTSPRRTCVLEATSDFLNWSPMLTNITSLSGTVDFTVASNSGAQFFRATAAP